MKSASDENRPPHDRLYQQRRILLPMALLASEAELLDKLSNCGIQMDRVSLQAWSQSAGSADEIARSLSAQDRLKPGLSETDHIWVWAVITALWEQWFPESPNFEMFDDRVYDGYDRPDRRDGCREWLEAWDLLLKLTEKLKIGRLQVFDERFTGAELVRNWVQYLEMELGDLARPKQDSEWFQHRKRFSETFLLRFPEEDKPLTENMRRAWAESLFALGEPGRAEESFRRWLQEDPRWSWGWIGWDTSTRNRAARKKLPK